MWENKTRVPPHSTQGSIYGSQASLPSFKRKHTHRNREQETTFFGKYSFDLVNMDLVNATSANEWSFRVDTGDYIIKQIKKRDFETPGVDYRMKMTAAFKFVAP